jgi:hypothetical protein
MNGPEEQGTGMREQGSESSEREAPLTEFEQALARAMRRVEVKAETTAKFYALAEEAEQKRVLHPGEQRTFAGDPGHAGGGLRLISFSKGGRVFAMPRPRAWMSGAIAAVLALGCFLGAHMHTEHERKMQAQQQFEAAERITDQTLERTREQLRAQGIYLDQ